MSECKKCNQKPVSKTQIGTIILGFYVLFSSGVGTVEIIRKLIEFFN